MGNKVDLANAIQSKKAGGQSAPVSKVEAINMAKKYGMEYFETCSVGEASIVQVFDHLFNSLLALVPNPPDPAQLMGKNVVLGQKVLNDIKFKLSLAEMLPNYDWPIKDCEICFDLTISFKSYFLLNFNDFI